MGLVQSSRGVPVVRKKLSYGESAFRAKLGTMLNGIGGGAAAAAR